MPTQSLPPNANQVLDHIQRTLAKSIQLAEEREHAHVSRMRDAGQSDKSSASPAQELETRMESSRQILTSVDRALLDDESAIRQYLASVTASGREITAWMKG